ncbi:MAG: hypothetical protein ACRD06_07895, partial [Terriglobia bacterium]
EALRRKAEARHDAEGLVFAAVRVQNASESARLAEKAVRLDPRLNWTYAVVAVRHPDLPQIGQWMPRLERWEPQNALFRLITAESIDIDDYTDASQRSSVGKQNEREADPAWRMTMAAAFASPKFDDYLGRLKELDQRVVRRYGYDHPQELLSGETVGLPTHAISDAHRFAGTLIQSGQAYESGGRRKRAAEEYWSVARFGQVLDSQAHLQYEHAAGASLQLMAYQRLQALSEKDGNADEAALFAYLGRKLAPGATGADALRERVFAQEVSRRNAAVLQVSGLMMLIFSGLLVFAAAALIARNRRRQGLRRFSPGLTVLALTSAVGLLLSSATLYLTYRPYWYIFQGAILKGETSQTGDLRSFLAATHTLPGLRPYPGEMLRLPVYFWTGVIFIGVIGLMLILVRHFRGHARLAQVQPNPRVQ